MTELERIGEGAVKAAKLLNNADSVTHEKLSLSYVFRTIVHGRKFIFLSSVEMHPIKRNVFGADFCSAVKYSRGNTQDVAL